MIKMGILRFRLDPFFKYCFMPNHSPYLQKERHPAEQATIQLLGCVFKMIRPVASLECRQVAIKTLNTSQAISERHLPRHCRTKTPDRPRALSNRGMVIPKSVWGVPGGSDKFLTVDEPCRQCVNRSRFNLRKVSGQTVGCNVPAYTF